MRASLAIRAAALVLLLAMPALAQWRLAVPSAGAPAQKTLFINCHENSKLKRVLSPISVSEGDYWRAYVEVDVDGCMYTTRLWTGRANAPYGLVYLMPPKRTAAGNGMEILGWARNSRMLLVMTEQWQDGADTPPLQQVLAVDAGTGMVYEPELDGMLEALKDKRCAFQVMDAGFSADPNVDILVRVKFFTPLDVEETLKDVPLGKRCGRGEETWSFNYGTAALKQVPNTQPLLLFKKFVPNPQGN